MKIKLSKKDMSVEERLDVTLWERNMLALHFADGWYYDNISNYEGWSRVLSFDGGKLSFHIPDDFEVGNLPQIDQNWDGHTRREKWERLMKIHHIDIDS